MSNFASSLSIYNSDFTTLWGRFVTFFGVIECTIFTQINHL